MIRRVLPAFIVLLLVGPAPSVAQARLTLADAVARARARNVEARIAAVAEQQAMARIEQARAGYWPKVDFTESWQRGDQPVFAFSSLLSQRRFAASNFDIDRLNHPDPLNNFRSAITVEQLLFDGGAVRAGVHAATLGRDAASLQRRQIDHDLAVAATEAFGQVLTLAASRRASQSAVEAAEEDLRRARARREAGLVTDADVLAIDVHLARMREERIRAAADEGVARTRLNQVLGASLDEAFELDPAPAVPDAALTQGDLEREAMAARPEIKLADVERELALADLSAARAGFMPQVGVHGGWEWNGGTFDSQVSSWIVGAHVRLNLFNGLANRARFVEAQRAAERRALETEKAETDVRLDVRNALARLEAARAREAVGRAALAQAQERQRITRDRYEAGLVDVTALLTAAQAVLEAESHETAARVDILVQAAALERALGR